MSKPNKNTKIKRVSAVLILILIISCLVVFVEVLPYSITPIQKIHNSLTPITPIEIDSDSDFISYGFQGNGSSSNPYIIENYSIVTSSETGIHIKDTTKYFMIRNCFISAESYGIFIEDVADGTAIIENNNCSNNYNDGIRLVFSINSVVRNNTCTDNTFTGIILYFSSNSTITSNNCSNSKFGVMIYYSSNLNITENYCEDNLYGIFSDESYNMVLTNNTFKDSDFGVYLIYSGGSILNNNRFLRSGFNIFEEEIVSFLNYTFTDNWINNKPLGFFVNLNNASFLTQTYGHLVFINCTNIIIKNQEISDTGSGILLRWCYNISIFDSIFLRNKVNGVSVFDSTSTNISNLVCSGNPVAIRLKNSPKTLIRNCTFFSGGLRMTDMNYEDYLTCDIMENKINDKILGYFVNETDLSISEAIYGQLILINCSNSKFSNQILANLYSGFNLLLCKNITLSNNTINNCVFGIFIHNSSILSINNNTCQHMEGDGIFLRFSNKIEITDNISDFSASDGIQIIQSTQVTLIENMLSFNEYGIHGDKSNITITSNICYKNLDSGIYLSRSEGCNITYNLLQENTKYGVSLGFYADNNIVHHNSFIDNNVGGTSQGYDYDGNNLWYEKSTKEGNYWSDWHFNESYDLDGESFASDPYPLGNPTVPPIPEFQKVTLLLCFIVPSLIAIQIISYRKLKKKS